MANNYYTFTPPFVPGTKVRSDAVNNQYAAIENAFDLLPSEADAITTGTATFAPESGSGNAYVVTMPDTRTINQDGDEVVFFATHTNTGAATFNVDGIGAISLVRADGAALVANDVINGLAYTVRYDATNVRFQLMTPNNSFLVDAAASAAASAASAVASDASATASAASAVEAMQWAVNPEDDDVDSAPGQFSAFHWAQKALGAATTSRILTDLVTATPPTTEAVSGELEIYDADETDQLARYGFVASNQLVVGNLMHGGTIALTQEDAAGTPGSVTWDGSQLLLPQEATPAAPTIAFGDGDTGFYEETDGELRVAIEGVERYEYDNNAFASSTLGSFRIARGAASNVIPAYAFNNDTDSGIGSAAADQLSLIAGGVEMMRLVETGVATTDQLIIGPAGIIGTAATPSLAFGDGDTGFYESADDDLRFAIAGVGEYFMDASQFGGIISTGPSMRNESASTINPTLIPNRTDGDTGIGGAGSDQFSLIAGGVELMRLTEDAAGAGNDITANAPLFVLEQAAAKADATAYGQVWVRSDDPNTLMFTDDTGQDFPIGGDLAGIGDGSVDGQMLVWDQTTDQQYEPSIQLTIAESAAAGGSVNFYGAGVTKTEFMRWSATDGGVVHILEPSLRLQNSSRIDLWPTGEASRPYISGLSGSSFLEFTAENTGGMIGTGAIFRYPISTQSVANPPTGILGDTSMLWSYQFNSAAGTVLFTQNEDDIVFPVGAPRDQVWTFNSPTAAADPGAKFMRMDTADFSTAGSFYFDDQSAMEPDAGWWFGALAVGDILLMTTGVDRNRWCYALVDTITDNTGWWTIDFTVLDHSGTNFLNADEVRIGVQRQSLAAIPTFANTGFEIRSAGDTDAEDRFIEFTHSDSTLRGTVGHDSDALELINLIHSGHVILAGEDVSGNPRVFIDGDPDVGVDFYHPSTNVNAFSTAAVGIVINEGVVVMTERSASLAPSAGDGWLWVKNNAPNELWFTDDTADDYPVATAVARRLATNASYNINTAANEAYNGICFYDNGTAYEITLENSSSEENMPVDSSFQILSAGTGTITITEGTTTQLNYIEADGTITDTAGGCTLTGGGGIVTVYRSAAGVYYIWGAGITA